MAWTLLQHTTATGFAPAVVATFSSPCTPGSLIVAFVTVQSNSASLVFSDGVNSWTTVVSGGYPGQGTTLAVGYAQNSSSLSIAVTATGGTTGVSMAIAISEWTGQAASGVVDASVVSYGFAGTASATLSTAHSGDLVFAGLFSSNGTGSAGAGWTGLDSISGYYVTEYQVQGAAGSVTVPFVVSGGVWDIAAVAFVPSGGATTTLRLLPLTGVGK